jgi:Nickel responsive protein SCO4226-like
MMKDTETQGNRGHENIGWAHVVEFRATEVNMAQFVIEREIPNAGELSETQIRELSLKSLEVLGQMGPKIRWLHSYVTDNKIYCVYLAADEAAIREHAQKGGFPANRISKVRKLIDPVNFE